MQNGDWAPESVWTRWRRGKSRILSGVEPAGHSTLSQSLEVYYLTLEFTEAFEFIWHSCLYARLIKHYAMKTYVGVEV
jgi:hypothetical protein